MERQIESIGDELSQFVKRFEVNESILEENAQLALKEFQEKQESWVRVLSYGVDCQDKNGNNITGLWYGCALVIYTKALRFSKNSLNEETLNNCEKYITFFEKEDSVKYNFYEKYQMKLYVGLCWNRIQRNDNAIKNLREAIHYWLRTILKTKYSLECYQYKPCSKLLFQSLANSTLKVSSPTVFNDVFDTPILNYLNQGDEEDNLLKKVFEQCVKVACFTSNNFLPDINEQKTSFVHKPKGDFLFKEYGNILMWAHYADSHRGICIKYQFPTEISVFEGSVLTWFGDVIYTDDLSSIYKKKSINEIDAFFTKAKVWEYENEVRYLYFNKDDCETKYRMIPMKENYIEAVYFGVNCDEEDKNAIINILKGRTIKKDGQSTPIEFYQMKKSNEKYGEIYAEKI